MLQLDYDLGTIDFFKDTHLCNVLKRHRTDKATLHNYSKVYHRLFSKYIGQSINYFELGIGSISGGNSSMNYLLKVMGDGFYQPGASLRGFSEYFQNANIHGSDIDRSILFNDDNILTYFVDQLNVDSIKLLWENVHPTFDIMIEDGIHTFEGCRIFFENCFHKLKPFGFYIIEDVHINLYEQFNSYFKDMGIYYKFLACPIDARMNDEYCKGDVPVHWKYPLYQNNLIVIVK